MIMKGVSFGLIGNIVVGVIGSLIGGRFFGLLGIAAGGLIGSIIAAVVGVIILFVIVRLIKRAQRRSLPGGRRADTSTVLVALLKLHGMRSSVISPGEIVLGRHVTDLSLFLDRSEQHQPGVEKGAQRPPSHAA